MRKMAETDTRDGGPTALELAREETPQAKNGEDESACDDKTDGEASGDEKPGVISAIGWKQLMGNDLLIKVRPSSY